MMMSGAKVLILVIISKYFRDFVTFDFVTLSTFVLEGSQSLRGVIRIIYYYNNI